MSERSHVSQTEKPLFERRPTWARTYIHWPARPSRTPRPRFSGALGSRVDTRQGPLGAPSALSWQLGLLEVKADSRRR
jgi:hypothetical protein